MTFCRPSTSVRPSQRKDLSPGNGEGVPPPTPVTLRTAKPHGNDDNHTYRPSSCRPSSHSCPHAGAAKNQTGDIGPLPVSQPNACHHSNKDIPLHRSHHTTPSRGVPPTLQPRPTSSATTNLRTLPAETTRWIRSARTTPAHRPAPAPTASPSPATPTVFIPPNPAIERWPGGSKTPAQRRRPENGATVLTYTTPMEPKHLTPSASLHRLTSKHWTKPRPAVLGAAKGKYDAPEVQCFPRAACHPSAVRPPHRRHR